MSAATQLKSRSLYNPYHSKIATFHKRADKGTATETMVNLFKLHIKPILAFVDVCSSRNWVLLREPASEE